MNPVLAKAKADILAKYARFQKVLEKAEHAGQQVMFAPQTRHMMLAQLGADPSNPEVIGAGVAKLIGILYSESKKTLPPVVFGPLSVLLLCDGLDFLEEAGKVQVTPDFLAQCMQAASSAVLQLLGLTPEKLHAMMQQGAQGQPGAAAPAGAPPVPAPGAAPSGAAPGGIVGGAMQGGAA